MDSSLLPSHWRSTLRALALILASGVLLALLMQPGMSSASPSSRRTGTHSRPPAQNGTNEAPQSLLAAISQAKLTASDGAAQDHFGGAAAVSGGTAVVGANADDTQAGSTGSAYVFVLSGTVWTEQAKLIASDGAEPDGFGFSVAVAGDTAVVGAPGDDTPPGFDGGSAYVFVRSGTIWTEQAKLTASDGGSSDSFGYSVAVAGETAIVGAIRTPGTNEVGAAYVFVRSGSAWTEQAKLTASDGVAGDLLGNAVALAGDTAVVGARRDDTSAGSDAGSAYVFVRSGTAWTEQAKLTASDGAALDEFGWSVAASGDTAVVGAPHDDNQAGSAYAFVRSGSVWAQQAKLTASDRASFDDFGWSVALAAGRVAVVGAPLDHTQGGAETGSAYAFVRFGTAWTQRAKVIPPDGATGDEFGYSVALTRGAGVVGARGGGAVSNPGSAYVYWR